MIGGRILNLSLIFYHYYQLREQKTHLFDNKKNDKRNDGTIFYLILICSIYELCVDIYSNFCFIINYKTLMFTKIIYLL